MYVPSMQDKLYANGKIPYGEEKIYQGGENLGISLLGQDIAPSVGLLICRYVEPPHLRR